ncbi:ABC transporter ATP-binding protein [Pseudoramibacter faecis]|uniref:ABC transporter ATP-binding protein n=1 Tax=Pseudoramibacter faecis TaxID=3108534 RepID=UPI002E776828|nr:ABC transporter ATP-binding protein [Pseudoramibacter sp. HA2172]
MIELEQVSFRYAETETKALQNISLKVGRGKCVVLSGSSGCGKTTVTRLINGLIPSFYPGELSGTVKIDGEDIAGCKPHELAMQIGSVFQNPRTQFFNTDTDSEIVFGMENCGISYKEMHDRYERTVNNLNLENLCGRDIFALSGGEKQQIAFGSIYALSPEIYVLDEPSANLDRTSTLRLRNLLLQLKNSGKTLLISEHRLYYLRDVADQVALIHEGRLSGLYDMNQLAATDVKALNSMGLRTLWDVKISASPASCPVRTPALEIRNLSVERGKKTVLKNINISADYGDIVGVIGENGIGKTTLARTVCGLMKEKTGSIYLSGQRSNIRMRKQNAFLVMQDPNYQLFSDSVIGETALTASGEIPNSEDVQRILSSLELTCVRDRHPLSLSGGQKQRLCVALAALSPARILFFDEPTSGLDFENMNRVARMLKELSKTKTIIVISHDNEFLSLACTKIISLAK